MNPLGSMNVHSICYGNLSFMFRWMFYINKKKWPNVKDGVLNNASSNFNQSKPDSGATHKVGNSSTPNFILANII